MSLLPHWCLHSGNRRRDASNAQVQLRSHLPSFLGSHIYVKKERKDIRGNKHNQEIEYDCLDVESVSHADLMSLCTKHHAVDELECEVGSPPGYHRKHHKQKGHEKQTFQGAMVQNGVCKPSMAWTSLDCFSPATQANFSLRLFSASVSGRTRFFIPRFAKYQQQIL